MKFKKLHKLLITCVAIFGFSAPSLSLADTFGVSPFALYEQAESNIVIDGVSTKYALGVAGARIHKTFNTDFTVSSHLGYGQNNNQKTSFAGANFNGKVTGSYLSLSGKYEFQKKERFNLFATAEITRRKLKASNLIGKRNNLDLTGSSDTSINSEDVAIGVTLNPTKFLSLELAAGISNWHIKSDAKAFYSSNGLSATATKSIDAKGSDPTFSITLATNKDNHNLSLNISNRSLRSKTNTSITTAQLNYIFHY